jgi:hypothetical protein
VSNGEITVAIERFIQDHIHSVEPLEILLLLSSTPDKEWSAAAISQQLYRQVESVGTCLEDFCTRGFLSKKSDGETVYWLNPATRDLQTIKNLDQAYRIRKDAVIRLIFSKPQSSLRSFSDAFRIRRDD